MTENREPLNLNAFLPPDHTLTIEPREDPDEARYRRRREERTWWFVIGVRSLFSTLIAAFVVGGMGYLVGNKSTYETNPRGAVMQWKGVIHGNVVVLDEGGQLPDGVRVTVTLDQTEVIRTEAVTPDDLEQRRTWAAQMRAFGHQLTGRQVQLGDLVLEGREELEERV